MSSTTAAASAAAADASLREHVGDALVDWLRQHALPLWARVGVDTQQGGYFEKIDLQVRPLEEPRRARVVARQIYVFATAARRGWMPDGEADALVEHGLSFLLERMLTPQGHYAAAVRPDGSVVRGEFDLYEQAFVLFALASARRGRPDREALRQPAEALLQCLRSTWAHPLGGFEETLPRSTPLRSNPHMHLLEAALEWVEVSHGAAQQTWRALADELVALCLRRYIDPASGALREFFDAEWQPMPDASGRIVEPGHQFEWSWLLQRWARMNDDATAAHAALRLLEVGEEHGIDRRHGVAIDALDDTLQPLDPRAKLWPQTERIKAWHEAALQASDANAQARAACRRGAAIAGLSRFLLVSPTGLWREQMTPDGGFVREPVRASSLYHIVCSIEVLTNVTSSNTEASQGA